MEIVLAENSYLLNCHHELSETRVTLAKYGDKLELSLSEDEVGVARVIFNSAEDALPFLKHLDMFLYRFSPKNERQHKRNKTVFEKQYFGICLDRTVVTIDRDTWGGDYFAEALRFDVEIAEPDKPYACAGIHACIDFYNAEMLADKIRETYGLGRYENG